MPALRTVEWHVDEWPVGRFSPSANTLPLSTAASRNPFGGSSIVRERDLVWTFIARLVLGLVLSAISQALSPRPKVEKLITGPNVVWAGDLKVDPVRKKGGKK